MKVFFQELQLWTKLTSVAHFHMPGIIRSHFYSKNFIIQILISGFFSVSSRLYATFPFSYLYQNLLMAHCFRSQRTSLTSFDQLTHYKNFSCFPDKVFFKQIWKQALYTNAVFDNIIPVVCQWKEKKMERNRREKTHRTTTIYWNYMVQVEQKRQQIHLIHDYELALSLSPWIVKQESQRFSSC